MKKSKPKGPRRVRAAGYIRVSDESQVDGHSLEAQRREIRRYCEAQGYELVAIYADEGVSVGGININTDFPWFVDAFFVLVLVALVYIGKKFIDRKFASTSIAGTYP